VVKSIRNVTGFSVKDLAPDIYRQRLVVEGYPKNPITAEQIKDYLSKLSGELKMVTLLEPIAHLSPKFGWAGWIHWETSGAHFYAWDRPRVFFSVDIYTCLKFSNEDAVRFTKEYFDATEVVWKEV